MSPHRKIWYALLILAVFATSTAAENFDLRQKADAYQQWLRAHHVPDDGGIVEVVFETSELENVGWYRGLGDSTMWTSTYLAAESFRYSVTGDPEAKSNAIDAVRTLHLHKEITRKAGYIGRFVGPIDIKYLFEYLDSDLVHYGQGLWQNKFYLSNSSSDQYIGWFFGMSVAYDLIDDEPTREIIRGDVRDVIEALRHHLWLILNEDGIPTTAAPNISGTERLVFCLIAAHILDEQDYWDLYEREFADSQPTFHLQSISFFNKYTEYFAFNLRHVNYYNIFRLEPDPQRRDFYLGIFTDMIRPNVEWTHNAWFDQVYLTGCREAGTCVEQQEVIADVIKSLTDFPDPPNREIHVNCPPLTVDPVSRFLKELSEILGIDQYIDFELQTVQPHEIVDRCREDFLWQRSPYHRTCYGFWDSHVSPGVDYLLAYWLARYEGFIDPVSDDDDNDDDDNNDDDFVDDDDDDNNDEGLGDSNDEDVQDSACGC